MIIDPEDIEVCEEHLVNYVAGDVCPECEKVDVKNTIIEATKRIKLFNSFLRAVINDGGASKSLKDGARDLLAG